MAAALFEEKVNTHFDGFSGSVGWRTILLKNKTTFCRGQISDNRPRISNRVVSADYLCKLGPFRMTTNGETSHRSYFDKPLPGLPAIITLDLTRQCLLVENLTAKHLDDAFDLVLDGAQRGDNIGIDEFPTSKEDFRALFIHSTKISLRDVRTLKLGALVVIERCPFSRSFNPYLATIHIFTCAQFSQRLFWRDLARLAQKFAVEIQLGYGGCVTNVFDTCLQRMLAFREEGFSISACIHDAGQLSGSESYVQSYVMHKDFGLGEIPKMALDVVRKLADDECDDASAFALKTVSFLPVEHRMHDGRSIVIRNMNPNETDLYHSLYDQGFGLDEWPTKRFFVERCLRIGHNFVVEEKTTGNRIALVNLMSSVYARSRSSQLCDIIFAIRRESTGMRYGTEFPGIFAWIAHRMGFTGVHTDCVIISPASLRVCYGNGLIATGVIPRSIYFADQGWVDTVLLYSRLDRIMKEPEATAKI